MDGAALAELVAPGEAVGEFQVLPLAPGFQLNQQGAGLSLEDALVCGHLGDVGDGEGTAEFQVILNQGRQGPLLARFQTRVTICGPSDEQDLHGAPETLAGQEPGQPASQSEDGQEGDPKEEVAVLG